MKDLRAQGDPRQLAELRRGATVSPEDRRLVEVRRARRRHRWTGGMLIAGVLAVVIAPHLIDATRISSVADRAAAEAGGPAALPLSCPAAGGYADAVNPPPPVAIERAVVCHYPAGPLDVPAAVGAVAPAQLALLNADLRANSRRSGGADATQAALGVPGRRSETWVVFGVTQLGQRVTLSGQPYPARFVWSGVGPAREWRPSVAVQQLLASALPF